MTQKRRGKKNLAALRESYGKSGLPGDKEIYLYEPRAGTVIYFESSSTGEAFINCT